MTMSPSGRRQRALGRRAPFGRFGKLQPPQPDPVYAFGDVNYTNSVTSPDCNYLQFNYNYNYFK